MNRSKLKTYAPQARRDFIKAITDRAAVYGFSVRGIEPMTVEGDVAIIGGRPFPKEVGRKREALEKRIKREGFDRVMEAVAYTWFNRFVALRYMEIHGYLDHGYRVLSNPDGSATPEIVEHAEHVTLSGLNKSAVIDLKLDGTKEEELYRMLLVAQCNALHRAMPFLFEAVNDETELLLPQRLLHSDSLIRKLVAAVPEEDWQEVEVLGWLYQFYISEKKDEVIGKVVKSEDIPAATQLFTPNWIVKYLVQNSLGRIWMEHHPDSPLKATMEYYIEPAEQPPEVQEQLRQIIQQRAISLSGPVEAEPPTDNGPRTTDHGQPSYSINPEKLTLLDPACGSGHILVEAYDLLKAIYQERGYRARDIPRRILRYNLYGLEIDPRAAQLASFALLMKARADDRRIFEGDDGPWMNVRRIRSSDGLDAGDVYNALTGEDPGDVDLAAVDLGAVVDEIKRPLLAEANKRNRDTTTDFGFTVEHIEQLLALFRDGGAETFGSLIRIPESLGEKLPAIADRADTVAKSNAKYHIRDLAREAAAIAEQALLLWRKYDAVVANPPYMGNKGMNGRLKAYMQEHFRDVKTDLFAAFIVRNTELTRPGGQLGFMSPFVWMFISSYEKLRLFLIDHKTITSLIQLEYSGFDGATVPICTFTLENSHQPDYKGGYVRLSDFRGAENQGPKAREIIAAARRVGK